MYAHIMRELDYNCPGIQDGKDLIKLSRRALESTRVLSINHSINGRKYQKNGYIKSKRSKTEQKDADNALLMVLIVKKLI